MSTVGFIGLGAMGAAIAGRLVNAGHDVIVWNRSPEPVEVLVASGARRAASAAEALAANVSFSMVSNDEAVAAVLTHKTLEGESGRVHVCLSSISPAAADATAAICRDHAVGYVAAPVLGRPEVAAAGQLNVLLAGRGEDVDRVRDLVAAFSTRAWDIAAEPRAANIVKIAVNYNILHALQAIGESVALVERNGADAEEFVELLHATLFGGVVHGAYGPIIARRAYRPPGFTLDLGLKDLMLACGVAEAAGLELLTMPALQEAFRRALADPSLSGADWSAIAEVSRGASH